MRLVPGHQLGDQVGVAAFDDTLDVLVTPEKVGDHFPSQRLVVDHQDSNRRHAVALTRSRRSAGGSMTSATVSAPIVFTSSFAAGP